MAGVSKMVANINVTGNGRCVKKEKWWLKLTRLEMAGVFKMAAKINETGNGRCVQNGG